MTWAHRVQATAIYTVDGSRKAVKIGRAMEVRSARAAVRHDGLVLGSRLHEEHEGHDNYLAELTAQLWPARRWTSVG